MATPEQHEIQGSVDNFNCSLCQIKYQNPRTLSCLHSFCLSCLQLFISVVGVDSSIKCPTCDKCTSIPGGGVEKLECVAFLRATLEFGDDTIASETNIPNCEICEKTKSSLNCKTCQQSYCDGCLKKHDRMAKGAKHELKVYTSKIQAVPKLSCEICENNPVKKFCRICPQHMCAGCAEWHGKVALTKSHVLENIDEQENEINCSVCERAVSSMYCKECCQHMCENCTTVHSKMKITKCHVVIRNEDVKKDVQTIKVCIGHSKKPLKHYCESCKILICDTCEAGEHKNHQIACSESKSSTGNFEKRGLSNDTPRCGSLAPGADFSKYGSEKDREHTEIKPINILVLGETGVGKSTWINAMANYVTYDTLMEARQAKELLYLIPTSFLLLDKNYDKRKIQIGPEYTETEVHSTSGQSATQEPVPYVFKVGDLNVRIIDTPGIGDVRGLEQDKLNFEKILAYLATTDELHGICILLKSNNARLNLTFRFCITELLTHLHRSAAENVVFCFTNVRATFYAPGDTYTPLSEMLDRLKLVQDVKIALNKNTMFCLDNESFRFLCALHHEVPFSDEDIRSYEDSWFKSRSESTRLFECIINKSPHLLSKTLSLNEARSLINMIIRPMTEIRENLQANIQLREEEMKKCGAKVNQNGYINVQQIKLVTNKLDKPGVACQYTTCSENVIDSKTGVANTVYKRICRSNFSKILKMCVLSLPIGSIPAPALIHDLHKCPDCGCSNVVHIPVSYTTLKEVYYETVESIDALSKSITDMETTSSRVSEISAHFVKFLTLYAIVPYNDAYIEYIDVHIKEENERRANSESDKCARNQRLKVLNRMKQEYENSIKVIEEATTANSLGKCISPEEVYKLRDELYSMKNIGDELKTMVNASSTALSKTALGQECVVEKKCKNGFFGLT